MAWRAGAYLRRDRWLWFRTCEAYHRVPWKSAAKSRRARSAWRLKEGGIAPGDVQYISYHGTSTELNDRIETRAVKLPSTGMPTNWRAHR
jgi:3-oxoacyl-[acyl-carrier-protein] synthase II